MGAPNGFKPWLLMVVAIAAIILVMIFLQTMLEG